MSGRTGTAVCQCSCGETFTPSRRGQKYIDYEHRKAAMRAAYSARTPSAASSRRERGYAPWKPHGKTRELLAHVDDVLVEYEHQKPLTLRQIFYRLIAVGAIKKSKEAANNLSRHLARARRSGRLPFDAFRDDRITCAQPYGGGDDTSPADYIAHVEDQIGLWLNTNDYRRDPHEGQPYAVELWCEAAGMLPQLGRAVGDYGVPVFSCGGYASLTANKEAADRAVARDVPTVLLHVGDLDKHGRYIYKAWADDVKAFAAADGAAVEVVRVALTPEQAAEHGLTVFDKAIQAEALPPDVLDGYVRGAVLDFYDEDIAAEVQKREAAERDQVDGMLAELRERIGFAG